MTIINSILENANEANIPKSYKTDFMIVHSIGYEFSNDDSEGGGGGNSGTSDGTSIKQFKLNISFVLQFFVIFCFCGFGSNVHACMSF